MIPSRGRGTRPIRTLFFKRDLRATPQREARSAANPSLDAVRDLTAALDAVQHQVPFATPPPEAGYNLLSPIRGSQRPHRDRSTGRPQTPATPATPRRQPP